MPELRGASVVVTGGAGFIGSHLVDALVDAGADRVVVVDTFFLGRESNLDAARTAAVDRLTIYREDAADATAMRAICEQERPEFVFNLATKPLLYSFFNPVGAFETNTDIARVLAELLREGAFGRLVHVSSSEVYGTAQRPAIGEDHPLLPETTYAAGKAAADLLLAAYVKMFDLEIVTLRPFNNFGPRQNDGAFAAVVPETIRRLAEGRPPMLEGDGRQTRDFIFVKDTVQALLGIAVREEARGLVLNLGSGRETPIEEVIRILCELYGYDGALEHMPPRRADVRRHRADVTQLEALLGPMSLTPLRDGLAQTLRFQLGPPADR